MTKQQFLDRLILKHSDYKVYKVKFYDDKSILEVKAPNFSYAGVLAMAWKMHTEGVGWGIEYIENQEGVKLPFDIKQGD